MLKWCIIKSCAHVYIYTDWQVSTPRMYSIIQIHVIYSVQYRNCSWVHGATSVQYIQLYITTYIYIYIYVCMCMYVYVCVCVCVCMRMCMCMYMCMYMCMCMDMCMCMYISILYCIQTCVINTWYLEFCLDHPSE